MRTLIKGVFIIVFLIVLMALDAIGLGIPFAILVIVIYVIYMAKR